MISIICATNRKGNKSKEIAQVYFKQLLGKTTELVRFLSLEELSPEVLHLGIFEETEMNDKLLLIQDKYFIEPEKWIWVVPEYNGGVPGVLKLLIDSMSVRKYSETFEKKKVCLVGVSSGRAGNLRGLDYLTNVLHYLKANVFPNKLPISGVDNLVRTKGDIFDKELIQSIDYQIDSFVKY